MILAMEDLRINSSTNELWSVSAFCLHCAVVNIKVKNQIEEKVPDWTRLIIETTYAVCEESNTDYVQIEEISEWTGIDPDILIYAIDELVRKQILIEQNERFSVNSLLHINDDIVYRESEKEIKVMMGGNPGWPIAKANDVDSVLELKPIQENTSLNITDNHICSLDWINCLQMSDVVNAELLGVESQGEYSTQITPKNDGSITLIIEDSKSKSDNTIKFNILKDNPLLKEIHSMKETAINKAKVKLSKLGLVYQNEEKNRLVFVASDSALATLQPQLKGKEEFCVDIHFDSKGTVFSVSILIKPGDIGAAKQMFIGRIVRQLKNENIMNWNDVKLKWSEQQRQSVLPFKIEESIEKVEFVEKAWSFGEWLVCYQLFAEEDGLL